MDLKQTGSAGGASGGAGASASPAMEVDEEEEEEEEVEEEEEGYVQSRGRGGRGSHNVHCGPAFLELFPETNGVPVPVMTAKAIINPTHRALYNAVQGKAKKVPEWVIFTKYGLACATCW